MTKLTHLPDWSDERGAFDILRKLVSLERLYTSFLTRKSKIRNDYSLKVNLAMRCLEQIGIFYM